MAQIVALPSRGISVSFPDDATPEEIQEQLDYHYPRNGQDVAYDFGMFEDFHKTDMTLDDYKLFREYNAENEKSASELVGEAASMLKGEMGAAFKEAWAGVKRGDIGDVAGSAFMGSMTGVFDIGDLVARMLFERKKAPDTFGDYLFGAEGRRNDAATNDAFDKLMKHDFEDFKDQMDRQGAREAILQKMPLPDVARGFAWIDPTIAIPVGFGSKPLVALATRGGRLAGKAVEVGGRGVAKFGEGARRGVAAATEKAATGFERVAGVNPAQAQMAARVGGIGAGAVTFPAVTAGVVLGPRAVGATGRVIEQAGIGLQQGVGRAGFFGGAAGRLAEGTLEHNLARGLSLLDKPLAYGAHGVAGASIGAGFGGVLGGLAEGREGFWHGVGAGGLLGGTMGVGMRGITGVAGLAGRAKLHADLQNTAAAIRASGDEAGALNFEKAMQSWDEGSLAILNDARRMTKRHHWHYVDDAAAKAMTDGAGFDGLHTIDRGDGTADVFINVDKLPFNKDGKPISSAASEELFHALVAEDVQKEFIAQLQTNLIGIEGYMSGMIHPWEMRTYGEAYGGLLDGQAKADFLARLDTALPKDAAGNITVGDRVKLADVVEEWGGGYFREWLKGKPRDYLLDAGRMPLLKSVFDRAKQSFLTTRRDTLNEAGARFDFRSSDIRKGFYDAKGKRIRMPVLDKMMHDFVRAKRTGEVPKIDSTVHTKVNLKKIGGEKAAILMEQQGGSHMVERLPDGTARVRKVEEVKAIEKEQSDMFLGAIERDAPETGAMIREDAEGWQITMTPKSVEGIMNHPMIDEAFKQRFGQVMQSIFGQGDIFKMSYWSATESRHLNSSNRVYNSLGLSERKVRFYDLRVNKKGGIYTMSADWSILEKRMNKLWGRTDVKALFDADRVLFNNEFRRYLENLTSPDPRPSAELFGVKQRDIFRDAVGPRATEFVRNPITFEAIGSKREALNAFKSFRIDRMSRLDQTGEAMPFTGETYGRVKMNLMPSAETRIKRRFMRTTEEGAKPKQPELFDPDLIKAAKLKIKKSRTLHPEALPLKPKLEKDGKTLKIGERTDRETGEVTRDVEFAQEAYKLSTAPVLPKGLNLRGASAKPAMQKGVDIGTDLVVKEVGKWSKNPDIMAGKGWYGKMRSWLQENFGASMEMFSHLLGATSARTGVADNFAQSRMAIRKFSQGDYDGLLQRFDEHVMSVKEKADSGALFAEWKIRNPKKRDSAFYPIDEYRKAINLFDEVPLKDNGTKYNANSMAVLKSLYGNWLETTKGPKTPNFAGNLTGRTLEATIDVWAARLLRRLLYSGKRKRWRILPEQEKGVDYGQTKAGEYTGDFVFAQKIFREAADRLGMSPDDLQAVVWFGEKDVWTKNGWTGSEGKKKSSFEEQAGKMEVERFTAGVMTYRGKESFDPVVFEQARTFLKEKAATNPDLLAARVTESEGYYGREMEPTFDAEFSLNKNANLHDIVEAVLDVGGDPRFTQDDVFISAIVSESHPNARPSIEVGFKSPATKVQADAVMEAFLAEGVDGFTLAKDERGNVIGIRAQYIPEISGRWESGHLSHKDFLRNKANWLVKLKKAVANLDKGVISYAEARNVSTIVYGREEYRSAGVLDPRGSDARSELGRRRHNLQTRAGLSETRTSRFMPSESSRREPPRGRGGVRPDDAGTSAGLATSKRFMPADESAYGRAVESGDTAAQQSLVDKAAKSVGYTIGPFYHGSDAKGITSYQTQSGYEWGPASYWTPEPSRAAMYGEHVQSAYLKIEKPLAHSFHGPDGAPLFDRLKGVTNNEKNAEARRLGYDGVIKMWGDGSVVEAAVFDPNQIKSADPITRDNAGNVIPLSERFDLSSKDIRFMPDSGAPNTSRNALGWSLIESKVGKWHVYRPDGTLAGIGGSKRSAENLFRTHYKRELRKSERDVKTRFMPGDAETSYREVSSNLKAIESEISRLGGWADWQRGDPRFKLNKQRGELQDKLRQLEVPYLREVTPHYDDIRTSLPDGAQVTDVRPYVIYRGESKPPEIVSITQAGGGRFSNVSSSEYPFIEATLSNGGKLLKQVRISDHPQVSPNAPRHYDVDVRLEGKLLNNKGRITRRSQVILQAALDDVVSDVWSDQRGIFRTYYKRELRKSERAGKTRFMPDTGEASFAKGVESARDTLWREAAQVSGLDVTGKTTPAEIKGAWADWMDNAADDPAGVSGRIWREYWDEHDLSADKIRNMSYPEILRLADRYLNLTNKYLHED